MKYAIDKQFGIWRYARQPVMGKWFFKLGEKMVNTQKYFCAIKNVQVDNIELITPDGYALKSYLITPQNIASDAVILYLHGGGFCFKGSDAHVANAVKYAQGVGCKLLFVEYRLAHNHPYPTPENDCFLMYRYLIDNAETLDISAQKIIVAGDSAGGNLTLGVFNAACRQDLPKPAGLMLIYPVVDNLMQTQSMHVYVDNSSLKI